MLEDLTPTPKVEPSPFGAASIEFDGEQGIATTPGYLDKPDFTKFLEEAGFDPEEYEIVGRPRTSRWQRYDGEWLTAYRFNFVVKQPELDLPTLYAQARRTKPGKPVVGKGSKTLVILAADFQIGKVASRGGTPELLARINASIQKLEQHLRKHAYAQIVILDGGDIIEGVDNAAHLAQLQSNDLSPMQQVDLAAAIMWDLLKATSSHAPTKYASVGSNHCQWRVQKMAVGKPGVDDWGIVILQQLRRLAHEKQLPVTFHIPEPHNESLALDIDGDGYHVVGLIHGHQVGRPDGMVRFLEKQSFGRQPLAAASIICSGHFHHTRIEEIGQAHNGSSKWWIQGSTMDNGSDWFRLTSGQDSGTGLTIFELEPQSPFTGTVWRY
jgi:hypothetical protein